MRTKRIKIAVIAGPTASGKTKLALDLARRFPLEVVSADSMQVYRYMDIGTAKPTVEERRMVPHHLIDIKDPDEDWSVQEFQVRACRAIEEIAARGALPLVVGGTGLYIRALIKGYPIDDAPPDPDFRREMAELAARSGRQAVHELLKGCDPASWAKIHPNDLRRSIRALEYFRATGIPISSRIDRTVQGGFETLLIGLRWPRDELYARIDERVEAQFAQGVVEETRYVLEMGYPPHLRSLQGLVYKEVVDYLFGLATLAETKALVKRHTRNLAKRQLTWFAREQGMIWIDVNRDVSWEDVVRRVSVLIEEGVVRGCHE